MRFTAPYLYRTTMPLTTLTNTDARRLFLHHHGLINPPRGSGKGEDLAGVLDQLGFVQVDSVNTLARAHDLILWSRQNQYRHRALEHHLARDRQVFEHWTHDASVLPIGHFPYWRKRFAHDAEWLSSRWSEWRRDGFKEQIDAVRQQISDHGACGSGDVGEGEARGSGGWWDWHPSKTALEYLWRSGELSVVRRDKFRKVYDLTERVIPAEYLNAYVSKTETIDWACRGALDRLGFATSGELAAFWALVSPAEAKDWCVAALARGEIEEIAVTCVDGSLRKSFAWPGAQTRADAVADPGGRVRLLSPFDPALRDRKRAERLFGFHYRIEIFVPEAKRQYGYYVFPVMEGTRLIGRMDLKADRAGDVVRVRAFWPERGVRFGAGRQARLETEVGRVAKLAGCADVRFEDGWVREVM